MPSGRFSEPRKVLRATLYSTGIGSRRISTLRLMPSAVSLVTSIFSAARYFFKPVVDERLERRRHRQRLELHRAHGVDHARHVGDRRQAGGLGEALGELVAEAQAAA